MIRVLIAEDMHMVRGALVALLSLEDDLEVVADVDTGAAILAAARRTAPDVAVLDVNLPELDGFTAARKLRRELPACRVVMVTAHASAGNLARAMLAEASGFLAKGAPPARLADAIRRVHRGERVIDPDIVVDAFHHGPNPLTDRERDVLACVAAGHDVSEVAARLYLATGTVRNYLSAIMLKIGARNRVDAVRIATDHGWLT